MPILSHSSRVKPSGTGKPQWNRMLRWTGDIIISAVAGESTPAHCVGVLQFKDRSS